MSDEIAKLVERLRNNAWDTSFDDKMAHEAADALERLAKENERLSDSYGHLLRTTVPIQSYNRSERELAEAREDTARLDEYERRITSGWSLDDWRPDYDEVRFVKGGDSEVPTIATPDGKTLRAAIDAVRAKEPT